MREGGNPVAIKISKDRDVMNAQVEARILKSIQGKTGDQSGLIQMQDCFMFRSFYVIVFEIMHINLFKYLKTPHFRGMQKDQLRDVAF
jgi:dual specificity tyrosine-phosphorylation-regulated kinase 2/3/4